MTVNYFQQANQQLKAGELKQAIASYQKAIQKNPNFAWYYQNLADALAQDGQMQGAIDNYEKAIQLNKDAPWCHYKLGKLLLLRGETEQAIAHLQKAINIEGDVADFYLVLGEALAKKNLLEEAINAYQQAMGINPNITLPYQFLGELLYKQGKLTEAINIYRQAIEANPFDWQGYKKLGEIFNKAGNLGEVLSLYQAALKLMPDVPEIYHHLGYIHSLQEDWRLAIGYYQQAIRLNPQTATVYEHLGAALSKLKRWDEAIKCYEQGVKFAPQSIEIYESLAKAAIQQEQWAIVTDAYQQMIKLNSRSAKFYHQLGYALAKQENWQAAINSYEKSIEINSDSAIVYQQLGEILEKLGSSQDLERAYQCYCQALKLDPNDAISAKRVLYLKPDVNNPDDIDLYWQIARSLVNSKKHLEAISIYQKIGKLLPENFANAVKLGDGFLQANALEDAIACYEKALEINPQASEVQHQLGEPLQRLGKLEEATECYKKAIQLNPEYFGSYHNLGDVLKFQGKLKESIESYRQAIRFNPHFIWSYHNLADALEKYGDLVAAAETYRQALTIDPNFAWSHNNLGLVLSKQENIKDAIVHFFEAERLQPQTFKLDYQVIQDAFTQSKSSGDELYQRWLVKNSPRKADFRSKAEVIKVLSYQPLISIIMPVFNTPDDFLRQAMDSVLDQIYPNWQLCIADDASTASNVMVTLEEYASKDDRIKILYRRENGHISASSNSALELATGEFITLFDHDDLLTPDALYEVVLMLNQHPEADMIYSDEDKVNANGEFSNPYFKPDWSPESFLTRMYTCHLGMYRKSIIDEIGGFRLGFEGAQDYDLVLRFTEKTNKIYHIPKILYHWRIHAGSTAMAGSQAKLYAYQAAIKAITEAMERRNQPVVSVSEIPNVAGSYLVRYKILEPKRVSIIIPTRNFGDVLDQCLTSIFEKTTYPNYEVIVIDNGSTEEATFKIFAKWEKREPGRFKCSPLDIPFNFSKINNYGVTQATGDYILLLNNDTEVITTDWLEAMVELVQYPEIGVVGPLLLYPDNTVQHAGVVMGIAGVASHVFCLLPTSVYGTGYFNNGIGANNVTAVTGACLMCRKEVFEEVGGLDETLEVAYNDIDLCLKIMVAGYRNLYVPYVKLYHYESKSRGYEDTPEKQARFENESKIMESRWQKYIDNDPHYNPNLTRIALNFGLNLQD